MSNDTQTESPALKVLRAHREGLLGDHWGIKSEQEYLSEARGRVATLEASIAAKWEEVALVEDAIKVLERA